MRRINGSNLDIEEDNVEVIGDKNTVRGNDNIVNGDENVILGDRNTGRGDGNRIIGNDNVWYGAQNKLNGTGNRKNRHNVPNEPRKRQRSPEIVQIGNDVWINGVKLDDIVVVKMTIPVPEIDPNPEKPLKDIDACMICLEYAKTCIVLPCAHKILCVGCARTFTEGQERGKLGCPACRVPMNEIKRVYE